MIHREEFQVMSNDGMPTFLNVTELSAIQH